MTKGAAMYRGSWRKTLKDWRLDEAGGFVINICIKEITQPLVTSVLAKHFFFKRYSNKTSLLMKQTKNSFDFVDGIFFFNFFVIPTNCSFT